MELQEERLADFGGIAEVVAQFKSAPCREAQRNFFSVILEHTVQRHIEARCWFTDLENNTFMIQPVVSV